MADAPPDLAIRRRHDDDLPALCSALTAQQPDSGYPMRWPLPFPIEDFIVRRHELVAWTAVVDDRPVGHVSVTAVQPDDEGIVNGWTEATGVARERLAAVSVLFVHPSVRGTGVGGRLHDVAVDWVRERGLQPVLDVVDRGDPNAAVDVYRHRGWRVVGKVFPTFLPPGNPGMLLMVLPPDA